VHKNKQNQELKMLGGMRNGKSMYDVSYKTKAGISMHYYWIKGIYILEFLTVQFTQVGKI